MNKQKITLLDLGGVVFQSTGISNEIMTTLLSTVVGRQGEDDKTFQGEMQLLTSVRTQRLIRSFCWVLSSIEQGK